MRLPFRSALPREVNLSLPSNRLAALGLAGGVLAARGLGGGWREALETGGAGFAAWATARELDPDHPVTAGAALPLAVVGALLAGTPPLPGSFAPLSALRVLSATVGHRPNGLDTLALVAQAALCARLGLRAAALLPGAALALSVGEADRFSPAVAPALGGVVAGGVVPGRRADAARRCIWSDLLTLVALGLAQPLTSPEAVRSGCDQVPAPVSARRVQRSRQLALGALGLGLWRGESPGLTPLAAAVLTVGLRRMAGGSRRRPGEGVQKL